MILHTNKSLLLDYTEEMEKPICPRLLKVQMLKTAQLMTVSDGPTIFINYYRNMTYAKFAFSAPDYVFNTPDSVQLSLNITVRRLAYCS